MKRWGICVSFCLILLFSLGARLVLGQELAALTGYVTDPKGLRVAGATVQATNVETNVSYYGESNDEGLFRIVALPTGPYRVVVQKKGFKTTVKQGLELHVQDVISLNFQLEVGSLAESVTVEARVSSINTQDATVSTVIDHNFVENLPLNGRSFQTLINLTPGAVLTPATGTDPGQFSVNGQRTSTNYFTIDGVSANIGVAPTGGLLQGASGTSAGFGVTGGTNNLVSEDALQEFRIQTSTYAPEFGRTPGAQISVVTRAGTNQFHGDVFEFLRNDKLDANDWFGNYLGVPRPAERINDFGGVLGGPIMKDRTFFFFSYEGQRLRLPEIGNTLVPSVCARQQAPSNLQPYLNAYPLPNDQNAADCAAAPDAPLPFVTGISNRSTLNATSLRLDQVINRHWLLFARYNYSPTSALQRGGVTSSLNTLFATQIRTQTGTLGSTWSINPSLTDELRFNYSWNKGAGSASLDAFGGAIAPDPAILYPASVNPANALYEFDIFGLNTSSISGAPNGAWTLGRLATNYQKQFNITDSLSWQKGAHALKFGVDYRRLTPDYGPVGAFYAAFFINVAQASSGSALGSSISSSLPATALFQNLGLFAQDSWKIVPRLTLTYGVRWDIDYSPSTLNGPALSGVTNFNDPANLALAPGSPLFQTRYGNFAPRVGVAYQLRDNPDMGTVIRGGFGVFYDFASTEVGSQFVGGNFPFGASNIQFFPSPSFPLTSPPPPIALPSSRFLAFDPNLELPRVYEWNFTVEQSLGKSQSISIGDVGAVGRRLLLADAFIGVNQNFTTLAEEKNTGASDYHALQVQYFRHMSRGLQALVSYTWSHSIDTGSSGSLGSNSNQYDSTLGTGINRGPSDFDIRNQLSAAVSYEIPGPHVHNAFARGALSNWSLENVLLARSALPEDITDSNQFFGTSAIAVRPDRVPGQPLYLYGSQCASTLVGFGELMPGQGCPGGRAFNPNAFQDPPIDPNTFGVTRQGNLGRNALRGFNAFQWDLGIRREFPMHEGSMRLQFRAELFNILNHPNFANPVGDLASLGVPSGFGLSTQTLAKGLGGNEPGGGGFASVFQLGGPRSVQFGLKLLF